ncbi:MAG TPA: gliding motility-associated ABC transporter ATP-binding subunit GldA, partial [Flavobacteriales bacterium]|nr:gliding motility-associated ABC transporter ATP-binding subunit GldA [Flavobacteriales bacterium]
GNNWIIESKQEQDIRPVISRFALDNGLLVLTIRKEEVTLEDAFKRLTGKRNA